MSHIIDANSNQFELISFIINQSFNSCGDQQELKEVADKVLDIINENYKKRIEYLNERCCIFQESEGVTIKNRFL
jgi:hypothetical protein